MRIIGGRYRNRRIDPPKDIDARPTTDFAREGLFNILHHSLPLEGLAVLDLFAGTGAVSAEFLSRGAEKVVSVEMDRLLNSHLLRLARDLDDPGWRIVKADVFQFLRGHQGTYDIIFADPPFRLPGTEELPTLVREAGLLSSDGTLIVEHPKDIDLHTDPWFRRQRDYGTVQFSFFSPADRP
ncbi:MAG: 16S rRNA (guanine(966)-N(2))-methyltransferase RsmD [Flavobacteriales bacterium]|nr:16S rRNA (guanine(966)-N(2))-methyltransferase RsmD [Flavobacteriales bacterium]MCB9166152.1 16S rRNA (guanine(966)-N(2))-methyltransferase RsmD [Flavobacteriales bacterium]